MEASPAPAGPAAAAGGGRRLLACYFTSPARAAAGENGVGEQGLDASSSIQAVAASTSSGLQVGGTLPGGGQRWLGQAFLRPAASIGWLGPWWHTTS